jgi:threonine/homoserine/homoserine lactone efflux protein
MFQESISYKCIELGIAYLLGIMIPGPSISVIIRNGILISRKASFQSGLGIVLGIAVQAAAPANNFCILGRYRRQKRAIDL